MQNVRYEPKEQKVRLSSTCTYGHQHRLQYEHSPQLHKRSIRRQQFRPIHSPSNPDLSYEWFSFLIPASNIGADTKTYSTAQETDTLQNSSTYLHHRRCAHWMGLRVRSTRSPQLRLT